MEVVKRRRPRLVVALAAVMMRPAEWEATEVAEATRWPRHPVEAKAAVSRRWYQEGSGVTAGVVAMQP
jgi:hypothetical protein